ncbi:MAG: hypothetical protein RLZ33_2615 [Bacteroidota bacterium]
MLIPNFKYIYADTNVISNICKEGGCTTDFLRHFPPGENYLLCLSTFTLYELSKSKALMPHFRKLFALFPCAILYSYFPLGYKEVKMILGEIKEVDPVLLTPQAIMIEGKKIHPDSLDIVLQTPSVLKAFDFIETKTEELFIEYSTLLEKEEFKELKNKNFNRNQFVNVFKKYELKHRFFGGKNIDIEPDKFSKMKTLEVLGQGLYYKFYSDSKRKISRNDVIDILIMTTAPYCHTYVSESNCIDIFRKIVRTNKSTISTKFMTISDLKK